jgi:hypothetical protein
VRPTLPVSSSKRSALHPSGDNAPYLKVLVRRGASVCAATRVYVANAEQANASASPRHADRKRCQVEELHQRLEYQCGASHLASTPRTRVPIELYLKRAARAWGKSTSLPRPAPG